MSAAAETAVQSQPARRPVAGLVRFAKLAVAVVVLALAGAYALHWWQGGRYLESTDDAYVGAETTIVSPKVSGFIVALSVTDNQWVKAGTVVARIDDRDYRAALARTDAAVDAQNAALRNLDAAASLQKAVIGRAGAEIDASGAELQRAGDDNRRYQDLVSRSSVSVESAQRTEATFKTARANVAKAQAELLATHRQLDLIGTQRGQVQAALEQARAEREMAVLNVGYTELRAPVDGYVGNRRARVGAFAAIGAPLLAVVPARGLWVDANFKEDQLAHMAPGQSVRIEADILPGHEFHGRLESVSPATGAQFSILPAENATGNFTKIVQRVPVRIHLSDADGELGRLRPGLSVKVVVDTRSGTEAPGPGLATGGPQ